MAVRGGRGFTAFFRDGVWSHAEIAGEPHVSEACSPKMSLRLASKGAFWPGYRKKWWLFDPIGPAFQRFAAYFRTWTETQWEIVGNRNVSGDGAMQKWIEPQR